MWLLIINGKRYRMSKRANCRKESAGEKNLLVKRIEWTKRA